MAQNIPMGLLQTAQQQYSQGTAAPIVAPLQTEQEENGSSLGVLKGMMAKGGAAQKLAQQRTLENQKGLQKLLSETDTGFQGLLQTLAIGAGNKLGQMSKGNNPDDEMLRAQGVDAIHGTLAASKDPNNPEQYFLAAQQLIGIGEPERAATMMDMGNTLYDNNLAARAAQEAARNKKGSGYSEADMADILAVQTTYSRMYPNAAPMTVEDANSIRALGIETDTAGEYQVDKLRNSLVEFHASINQQTPTNVHNKEPSGASTPAPTAVARLTAEGLEKRKRAIEAEVSSFSLSNPIAEIAPMQSILGELGNDLSRYLKRDKNGKFIHDPEIDIPGITAVENFTKNIGQSSADYKGKPYTETINGVEVEQNRIRDRVSQLQSYKLKEISGGTVTDQEREEVTKQSFPLGGAYNDRGVVNFYNELYDIQERKWSTKFNGMSKPAQKLFLERNNMPIKENKANPGQYKIETFPGSGVYTPWSPE